MMIRIFKYCSVLIIYISFLSILACSSKGSENESDGNIKFEVIKEGPISGFTDEKMMVINNNDDYQKIMTIVYYNLDQMPIIPEVDFTKSILILTAMGTKNTGGYTIGIDNISKSGSKVTVNLTETSPGKNCVNTESITSPYQIVKIKKTDKEIKFNISRKVKDCP